MNRTRQVMQKLLFPNIRIVLLSVPVAAAGLYYVFSGRCRFVPLADFIYALSFCALVWVCARLVRSSGRIRQEAAALIDRAPLVRRYLSDVSFRATASLHLSLGLNILYAAAKLTFGLYYRSVWFGTLAVYYVLLAVMRFVLLSYASRRAFGADRLAEWRRCRICGALLLVMNLALSGIVILVVRENEGFSYPGYLIYVMAAYAFYNVAAAVRNVIKFRRFRSPVMSAATALRLAAALVSMLALETAMLEQFGGSDAQFRTIMTGCTGGGVCAVILAIAVCTLRRSAREIQRIKSEEIP